MKFKNGIFRIDAVYYNAISCVKVGSQKVLTGSIGWSRSYGLHKKIMMIPEPS